MQQALARGHPVTAQVRDPRRLPLRHELLRVRPADMHVPESLEALFDGPYHAVVSALGVFPRAPSTELSRGTANVIEAMGSAGVQRLVLVSSFGVGGSDQQAPWLLRLFAFGYLFRHTIADKERQENLIKASDLRFTIVRPAGLYDGDAAGPALTWTGTGKYDKPAHVKRFKTSRTALATLCLDSLEDPASVGMTIMMSE